MTGPLGGQMPSGTAQAWDTVRRVREPVAWILVIATAVAVLVSAWQLLGLPGAPLATSSLPVAVAPNPTGSAIPVTPEVASFGLRASTLAPQFAAGGIFTLPVLSVVLVTFAGGLTSHARRVVQGAVSVQAVTLGLGLISWIGAFGAHQRQGVWFIFDATDLAAIAAALVFTVAVLRAPALRPLTARLTHFTEDDEDFGAGEDFGEGS